MRAAVCVSVLLAGLSVLAQERIQSLMEWLSRMDRNQDGRLSRQEAPSSRFKEFNADGNGFVSLAEYKAFLNRQTLKMHDRDEEGKISQQEFHQLQPFTGRGLARFFGPFRAEKCACPLVVYTEE